MGEDFYIIPSSVHECILLPKSCLKPTEIQKDLLAINASELLTGEKLSDKVYEYCSELKKIRVAEIKREKKNTELGSCQDKREWDFVRRTLSDKLSIYDKSQSWH